MSPITETTSYGRCRRPGGSATVVSLGETLTTNEMTGVAVDGAGNLFVADHIGNRIIEVPVGCGGGFLGPVSTQPGNYVVTITGTSGSAHASTTVTVVVQ
jgi:hypothetical protein